MMVSSRDQVPLGREYTFSIENIEHLTKAEQTQIMREWFRSRFEDPANRLPLDSEGGGYIWVWGGPFHAREELENEFGRTVSADLINDLATELENESWDWAPTERPSDYDDFVVGDISSISQFFDHFTSSVLDIEALLDVDVPGFVEPNYYRLLFVNVITALETYLSDAFINTVVPNEFRFRKFVENSPEFKEQKIPISQLFSLQESIKTKVSSHLGDVVWHNIARVSAMYKSTLNVNVRRDVRLINRAILTRHDIVHRNGKDRNNSEILISANDVRKLLEAVEKYVQEIDEQLPNDL